MTEDHRNAVAAVTIDAVYRRRALQLAKTAGR